MYIPFSPTFANYASSLITNASSGTQMEHTCWNPYKRNFSLENACVFDEVFDPPDQLQGMAWLVVYCFIALGGST